MGFTLLNNFTLLDSMSLSCRRKVFVKDTTSVFDNDGTYQYQPFNAENCSVQPLTERSQLLLDEGLREYESYTVYTTTALKSVKEASEDLADQVYINGQHGYSWFTVLKVKKHSVTSNGNQYEVVVVKYPNTVV